MAYTVTEAYNRILEEGDKLGSDYFSLPQVLKAFKKEVLDFVGSKAKQAEKDQEVTDDLRPLVVPVSLNVINNPDNSLDKIAMLPSNYHTRLSVNVSYNDGLKARKPMVERFGEHNTNMLSPNKRPEKMYPLIQQFSDYFNIITNIPANATVQVSKLLLIYIKQPTFGSVSTDQVVNLSDSVCELLFASTAATLRMNVGEPTAESDFKINQYYRNK